MYEISPSGHEIIDGFPGALTSREAVIIYDDGASRYHGVGKEIETVPNCRVYVHVDVDEGKPLSCDGITAVLESPLVENYIVEISQISLNIMKGRVAECPGVMSSIQTRSDFVRMTLKGIERMDRWSCLK